MQSKEPTIIIVSVTTCVSKAYSIFDGYHAVFARQSLQTVDPGQQFVARCLRLFEVVNEKAKLLDFTGLGLADEQVSADVDAQVFAQYANLHEVDCVVQFDQVELLRVVADVDHSIQVNWLVWQVLGSP